MVATAHATSATACPSRDARGRSSPRCRRSSRPALLTAGVAFTYGHLGMGSVGLAAVILFVFLYIVRTSVQAAGARRGADPAHARARLAADGSALDGTADALDARRDDRAPFGRRRPLLARGRGDAGARRARAGPDPHRRAAARHRQVHPSRLRAVREPQADRRRVGADQAAPRAGRQARRAHRGLRPRRRDRPATTTRSTPAAAIRPASAARRSRSARGSCPSRTPTT